MTVKKKKHSAAESLFTWYRKMCKIALAAVTTGTDKEPYRESAVIGSIGYNARVLETGAEDQYTAACKLMSALSELCSGMTAGMWGKILASVVEKYKSASELSEGFGLEMDLIGTSKLAFLLSLERAYLMPWKRPTRALSREDTLHLYSHNGLKEIWKERVPECLEQLGIYILCYAMPSSRGDSSSDTLQEGYLRRIVEDTLKGV